jgi:hypothetical protein
MVQDGFSWTETVRRREPSSPLRSTFCIASPRDHWSVSKTWFDGSTPGASTIRPINSATYDGSWVLLSACWSGAQARSRRMIDWNGLLAICRLKIVSTLCIFGKIVVPILTGRVVDVGPPEVMEDHKSIRG